MPLLIAIVAGCATNLVLGWYWGYHLVTAYLLSWLLAALAIGTSWNVVSRLFTPASRTDALVRVAVVSFAVVVLCGLVLGGLRQLSIAGYLAAESALFLLSTIIPRRDMLPAMPHPIRLPAWLMGTGGALLAFAIAFAFGHAPMTLYDSVSYHLFFAGRWLQDGALSIIPTPFSDEAQAYTPANGELFFVWLMLPFHGDLLARFGQLPFALLTAATLVLLARRLGASVEHALYPAAFFVLARPTLEEAVGANVDLVCAGMFVTSIYFGITAFDRDRPRDWILWGVSLGLYFGSKYVALVYTPIFLLLAVVRGPRLRMLWALPGIALFALPWYLRNWAIAGSPIYPASLTIAGVTLARGAFTRAAMLNTVFHTSDLRLFPVIVAHAFGPTLFLVWIPFAVIGGIAMLRRGWWPAGTLVAIPLLMIPLYWFGFPVNIDSRFLMPAIAPALLPLAFTFRSRPRWDAGIRVAYALAMAWVLVGAPAEIPAQVPWFMGGWLTLRGLLPPAFVGWFLAVAGAIGVAWRLGPRETRWAMPFAACLLAATTTALALGGERWCQPVRCDYLDTTSPFIRPNLLTAWDWMTEHTRQATVAYTGINLPYPLTGRQLTNRVVYANIDGRPRWRLHDYDRAYRAGRFTPAPPPLARSSGELMPVDDRPGPRDDAARPRYERLEGLRYAWVDNLRVLDVDYLFISALSAYEIDYVWHNAGGFPIEDEWAAADPRAFHLRFENPQVRIYAVDRRETIQ